MTFISWQFLLLLVTVLALLAVIKSSFWRKMIILAANALFYGYWDWRFLGLLGFITVLNYSVAQALVGTAQPKKRKALLIVSLVVNLGFLGFFKYFNFFINSFNAAFQFLGWRLETLSILLPIGISFYTFEALSYVLDVYWGKTQPADSLLDYAVFLTFFPRLVSGPITRAQQFLPQLKNGLIINLENIASGSQLFVRGMIKKLIIADNVAVLVDYVYRSPNLYASSTVWLGVFAYSIQIFCDFSGYTDMALGVGRMMGIELPQNFNLPYTAQSFSEFWRRWHISLSTWLRDYLYIPLGGNRKGSVRTYVNLMITMLLGGLWHGASWNFVVWGGLHGAYQALERAIFKKRVSESPWTSVQAWLRAALVFLIVSLTWVFFRSPSIAVTAAVFQKLLFINPAGIQWFQLSAVIFVPLIVLGGFIFRRFELELPMFTVEKPYTLAWIIFELVLIFWLSPGSSSPFVYFQF